MAYKSIDKQALRAKYVDYMISTGKSKNTATTTASNVFALWNNCGEAFFWDAIEADDTRLREQMKGFLEKYYPNQIRYLSGYLTSIRYFKEFLSSETSDLPQENQHKSVHQRQKISSIKSKKTILPLTEEMLEEEHKIVLADPGYGSDYALIDSILNRFPDNNDPELVALKIALIDMTNSTNIGRHRQKIIVRELADIIVGIKDFDSRLQQGDPDLVSIIARCNGRINLFSFASKYCTYHSVDVYGRDDYVILDSVVKEALPKYVYGLHKATIEQWRITYNYRAYRQCIDDLLDANEIHIPFRHRKLDHYLWHKYRNLSRTNSEE